MKQTLFLALIVSIGCAGRQEPATLVLKNGNIVTVEDSKPTAQAIAVRGDKIIAIGSDDEIQQYVGTSTVVVDLEGKMAMPGFIEGHGHFTGIGTMKMNLQLMNVKNWDEVVVMVAEAVKNAKPGEWITGRGWHQDKWDKVPQPNVEGVPFHATLDKVSPNNPVILRHASGHAGFANGKALQLAGITRTTPNPTGGEIVKDRQGNPTGFLRETAQGLVSRAYAKAMAEKTPEERDATSRKEIDLAMLECLSKGITSFQDAGSSFGTIDLLKQVVDEGKMLLRLWVMVRDDVETMAQKLPQYRMVGYRDNFLTVRAIKRTIDGALGPRGAWLLEPYSDMTTSTGLNTSSLEEAKQITELAMQHEYQFCVHAIGDRANREILDMFQAAFEKYPQKTDVRWRIEHAQHLNPADIPRFGQLGVIASMQGVHCTSDAIFVPDRLGDKRSEEGAYVWQKLMQSGALVMNGTDAPVEDVNPIHSFYASVSRKLKDGSVFYPDQRMSREEALQSYTINNAKGAFEENMKGSLAVGKLADIVVLSKDIMTIPEEEIPSTVVLYTIVGGQIVYQKQ